MKRQVVYLTLMVLVIYTLGFRTFAADVCPVENRPPISTLHDFRKDLSKIRSPASRLVNTEWSAACRSHDQVLTNGIRKRKSIADIAKAASRSDIVFIGESHSENERHRYYRDILRELKRNDRSFDCLLLEGSSVADRAFSNCYEKPETMLADKLSDNSTMACPGGGTWLIYGAINEALNLRMKVFGIDDDTNCPRSDRSQSYECRDNRMAQNLQAAIDTGKCSKIVSINGAAHLTQMNKSSTFKPFGLREYHLKDGKPLNTFRINFMFSRFDKTDQRYDDRYRWHENGVEVCETPPPDLNENFGFLHSEVDTRGQPLGWRNGPEGKLSDFNASIIIGTE